MQITGFKRKTLATVYNFKQNTKHKTLTMQTKNQMTRSAMLMAVLSCSQAVEIKAQAEAQWWPSNVNDVLNPIVGVIDDAIDAGNAVSDGLDNILDQINIPDVTLTLDDVIDIKQ